MAMAFFVKFDFRIPQAVVQSASMRTLALWGVVGLLAISAAPRLHAHHSFAMFDTTKPVTLTGKVTKFQWTNPHAYIELDVPDGGNPPKHWTVELGSTSILMQGGWKFTDVKPDQTITVVLSPLRDGQPAGLLVRITLADGRVLSNGPGPAGGAR
jgi:hypothetical protein